MHSPITFLHIFIKKRKFKDFYILFNNFHNEPLTLKGDILKWIEKNIENKRFHNYQHAVEYCINEVIETERFDLYAVLDDFAEVSNRKGEYIRISFQENKPFCEFCKKFDCEHIRFLLEIEEFKRLLKDKEFKTK